MELRRNEEDGSIERKVVTYETIEREELASAVAVKQEELEAQTTTNEQLRSELAEGEATVARLETELNDAKSGLEQYDCIAGTGQGEHDPRPEPTGIVDSLSYQGEASPEF